MQTPPCKNPECNKVLYQKKLINIFKKGANYEIKDNEGNLFCSLKCLQQYYVNKLKDALMNRQYSRVTRQKLGLVLIEQGKIVPFQMKAALVRQHKTKQRFGESLIEMGYINERDLTVALSIQSGVPWIARDKCNINDKALQMLPRELCRVSKIIPFDWTSFDKKISILIDEPGDFTTPDIIFKMTGMGIKQFITEQSFFKTVFEKYIGPYKQTSIEDGDVIVLEKQVTGIEELAEYLHGFTPKSSQIYKALESFLSVYSNKKMYITFYKSGNFQLIIEDKDTEISLYILDKEGK